MGFALCLPSISAPILSESCHCAFLRARLLNAFVQMDHGRRWLAQETELSFVCQFRLPSTKLLSFGWSRNNYMTQGGGHNVRRMCIKPNGFNNASRDCRRNEKVGDRSCVALRQRLVGHQGGCRVVCRTGRLSGKLGRDDFDGWQQLVFAELAFGWKDAADGFVRAFKCGTAFCRGRSP